MEYKIMNSISKLKKTIIAFMMFFLMLTLSLFSVNHVNADPSLDTPETYIPVNGQVLNSNSSIVSSTRIDSRHYLNDIQVNINNPSIYSLSNAYAYLPFASEALNNTGKGIKWDSQKNAFVFGPGTPQPNGTLLTVQTAKVNNKNVPIEIGSRSIASSGYANLISRDGITYESSDTTLRIPLGPITPGQSLTLTYSVLLTSPESTTVNNSFYLLRYIFGQYKRAYVTILYKDENGNTIADSEKKLFYVGASYRTKHHDIPGYTFKSVEGDETGSVSENGQIVTYIFKKNSMAGGPVTFKYVDENGNKISEPVVKSGNVGDEYSTEQKEIPGYTFKEVQGNATGTFTADSQTVTYVYTKNSVAPEKPVTPSSPEKPVMPDNGMTGSTTVNNTTNNSVVKTVKKTAQKMLPKTAAEKVGFSAILAIVLSGVTGIIMFKSRRNKQ